MIKIIMKNKMALKIFMNMIHMMNILKTTSQKQILKT